MKAPKSLLVLSISLAGCAAGGLSTVIPGDSSHQSIGYGYDEGDAVIRATDAAKNYCEDLDKRHVVVDKETKYTGTLDEESRNTADAVSAVASFAGAWTPSVNTNEDYQVTVTFRCD